MGRHGLAAGCLGLTMGGIFAVIAGFAVQWVSACASRASKDAIGATQASAQRPRCRRRRWVWLAWARWLPRRGTGEQTRRQTPRQADVVGAPRHGTHRITATASSTASAAAYPRTPWRKLHETHLPTVEGSPCTHTWLSGSHEDAGRACRDQRAARQGPQATRPVDQRGWRAA